VRFPGLDTVLLTFHELGEMVSDRRYGAWHVALSQVQGIYLIIDASNGKQYVGKADGANGLQRSRSCAQDGHGGNHALKELAKISIGAGAARPTTPHTSDSASCGCSARAPPPRKSTTPSPTTSGR
jgi:hypothetical protein